MLRQYFNCNEIRNISDMFLQYSMLRRIEPMLFFSDSSLFFFFHFHRVTLSASISLFVVSFLFLLLFIYLLLLYMNAYSFWERFLENLQNMWLGMLSTLLTAFYIVQCAADIHNVRPLRRILRLCSFQPSGIVLKCQYDHSIKCSRVRKAGDYTEERILRCWDRRGGGAKKREGEKNRGEACRFE